MNQARFQKQQGGKGAASERRQVCQAAQRGSTPEAGPAPARPHAEGPAELTELHEQFEAGLMTFEDFEGGKERLTAQLDVG